MSIRTADSVTAIPIASTFGGEIHSVPRCEQVLAHLSASSPCPHWAYRRNDPAWGVDTKLSPIVDEGDEGSVVMGLRRWFTREFKVEAVQLVTDGGLSVVKAMKDLCADGVSN